MNELHRYTPKLNFEDNHRVETAISHYEKYIDFPLLLERLAVNENEKEKTLDWPDKLAIASPSHLGIVWKCSQYNMHIIWYTT